MDTTIIETSQAFFCQRYERYERYTLHFAICKVG